MFVECDHGGAVRHGCQNARAFGGHHLLRSLAAAARLGLDFHKFDARLGRHTPGILGKAVSHPGEWTIADRDHQEFQGFRPAFWRVP